jgi:deazaflavin-dependent oxidoreductase (nitroreductase family)
MEKTKPPQPIPYPTHPILKSLYRLPILLYRLGLGPLIGKYILVVSTYGRKTGKVHRTPVEYYQHQNQIFVMSGFMDRPDWFQNLQENPRVGLNIKDQRICARARRPETPEEWEGVIAFLQSSPVAQLSEPVLVDQLDDAAIREIIQDWPILTFDHTNEPCPKPLKADLVWAWPLILLVGAGAILLLWLAYQNHKNQKA